MNRYVALTWNPTDASQAMTARMLATRIQSIHVDWSNAVDCDGLLVLHSGDRGDSWNAYALAERGGVVLGKLFKCARGASSPVKARTLDSVASNAIIVSKGRDLVDKYWGQYVAFIRDSRASRACALRDPSGGVLCYAWCCEGVGLYFSNFSDVVGLNPAGFSINWNYVLAEFRNTELICESTGIFEVGEVLAGQCHEFTDRSVTRNYYWNPAEIVRSNPLDDEECAVGQLRRTVHDCISGWASSYSSILHDLSGGLDSAIVLGCLAEAPERPEITCLNFHTLTPEGDERFYARLASKKWRCELIERELPGYSATLSELVDDLPVLQSPTVRMFGAPSEHMHMTIAKERGIDAFTTGEGGDHLFYQLRRPPIAADYIRHRGVDKEFINIALNIARLTGKSLLSTLCSAFEFGFFRQVWDTRLLDRGMSSVNFIDAEALASIPQSIATHEWSKDASDITPGKQAQIFLLPKILHRRRQFGRPDVADVIHPLVSQPIMETCLRIPSYLLTTGGVDRGLARRAFNELAPREIIARHSKGGTGSYFSRILVQNLAFVRKFVLDGVFARQGFIDRKLLDKLLTQHAIENVDNLFPLLKIVSIEAWLRKWESARCRAVAL